MVSFSVSYYAPEESEKAAAAGAMAHSNEHGTNEDEANTMQMRLNIIIYLPDAI